MTEPRKLITVRRNPSEYRQDKPWVARCRFVTCNGWTRYFRTNAAATHAAHRHSGDHWRGLAA